MDVQQYFKDYPGSRQCFQTADGLIFHEEGDARLHAQSLENKEVEKHMSAAGADESEQVEQTEPEAPVDDDNKGMQKGKKKGKNS